LKTRPPLGVQSLVKRAMIAVILVCGLCSGLADDKYYVQLIKATNDPQSPEKSAKAVGSKIGDKLSPLRWKYYWETERRDITIKDQKPRKVDFSGERAVEVAPKDDGKVEVRLYRGKQLSRKSCHKAHDRMMAIFGGDEGEKAWFIVVRREEPQYQIAKH
jgi:hypothetical protein